MMVVSKRRKERTAGVLLLAVFLLCHGMLPAKLAAQTAVPQSVEQMQLSFAPVVDAVASTVVSITSRKVTTQRADPFGEDPFFKFFFRDFGVPFKQEQREQSSLGSGVIVRGDGLIVTNHHVVDGADEISVVLNDRRELKAHLVASDERTDLAFLQLIDPPAQLPVIAMGDSDRLAVGDLVLALGNPFGIGQTVTSGIISAKSRSTPGGQSDVSFIQTDAAINPGNSGGALVSLHGELVGINTAIFTRGGGSIGIGFAIPANLVHARMLAINEDGTFARPWLGASVQPIDSELADALDLPRPSGVLVNRLYRGGAAERAGLKQGDVIVEADDIEIFDAPGLTLRMSLVPLGDEVRLAVIRGGREFETLLSIEAAPMSPEPDMTLLRGRQPFQGATVANMSPGFNEKLDINMFERGVVVVQVEPGSFATKLRLKRGDAIASINGEQPGSVAELEAILERGARRWELSIRRGGRVFNLTVG